MHAVFSTFSLVGMSSTDYESYADAVAAEFAQQPGLRGKVWLADPASNRYGALYVWDTQADSDAFRASELAQKMASLPFVADVQAHEFDVLDGPTKTTRGIA